MEEECQMLYGYFDDDKREYVITNPRTPVKWINYIGTLAFGGFVDQTGGALICKGDPALNRITKYIPQLPSAEFKAEGLYLRFRMGRGYRLFSPFFVPTLDDYNRYECHVGLGYTRFVSEFYGLRSEITVFVPRGGDREIRDTRVTNLSDNTLTVDAIPVVEYTHPDALIQLTNADWAPQTMVSRFLRDPDGYPILLQYPFMRRDTAINFFTSSVRATSFETDRAHFLGDHEYGTWASPGSMEKTALSGYQAQRGDNISALLIPLKAIHPGGTVRFITQLGQAATIDEALPEIRRYRDPAAVDAALAELAQFWDGYLCKVQVQTPDAAMNRMLNIHNPRQCYITLQWSRYLSLYQLGFESRGIGFRDSSQDVMGILAHAPAEGQQLISKLLQVQLRNGSAMHQFTPATMSANQGDSRQMEDRPKYYGDDHLWIILAVAAYVKETGDREFLDTVIPYYDKNSEGEPLETGTVLQHLQRAIDFTRQNTGAHGLPLLGFADWNDTVNLPSGAESLFVANLYGKALLEMIDLARHLGDAAATRYASYYDAMKACFDHCAWDGAWFVRYFDEQGHALGSQANDYGQIYANGQSWPVISGFALPEQARQALDALYARLNTRHGIKLSAPSYDGYDAHVGGISTYPPGAKENGGIFLHTNPWAIMAEAMLGNGERAFQYYAQINPVSKNEHVDEFECEPYVYPQNILGDEHPQFGLARNSWLTGTASWAYQAATQYILGIRPTYDGLLIDPCIPSAWDGFQVRREFRGIQYEIDVQNPEHVCGGVRSMQVNGQEIEGNVVPIPTDHSAQRVKVVLGHST
jgi:cellobiose phosphorylase